uniref:Uncharacterized protein n=1 Tax=Glossina austeni TaxID=7395 RepID=A0A1A9UWR2_GLOAU
MANICELKLELISHARFSRIIFCSHTKKHGDNFEESGSAFYEQSIEVECHSERRVIDLTEAESRKFEGFDDNFAAADDGSRDVAAEQKPRRKIVGPGNQRLMRNGKTERPSEQLNEIICNPGEGNLEGFVDAN